MNTVIYRMLNHNAKAWWYHRDLRKSGNNTEARKRERNSILSNLQTIRGAWFFSVGKGGWTIYYNHPNSLYSDSRLQGYGGIDNPLIQCCILRGVPGYDVTHSADSHFKEIWQAPLVSKTPDEPRDDGTYSGMMYAPVTYILKYYRDKVKAQIYNFH